MRPEVVKFLALDARLTDAQSAREAANRRYFELEGDFRQAWLALTIDERAEVNDACDALRLEHAA